MVNATCIPKERDDVNEGDDGEDDKGYNDFLMQNEGFEIFYKNVYDMVVTGYNEGHPAENVLMEIKGYKFSQNKVHNNNF